MGMGFFGSHQDGGGSPRSRHDDLFVGRGAEKAPANAFGSSARKTRRASAPAQNGTSWVASLEVKVSGVVAIDGKTLRGKIRNFSLDALVDLAA